jgi:hypothetical protein
VRPPRQPPSFSPLEVLNASCRTRSSGSFRDRLPEEMRCPGNSPRVPYRCSSSPRALRAKLSSTRICGGFGKWRQETPETLMKVRITDGADKDYAALSVNVRKAFGKQLELLLVNPRHPSLRAKKLAGGFFSRLKAKSMP